MRKTQLSLRMLRPFVIGIYQHSLEDLDLRLRRTRLPSEIAERVGKDGPSVALMRQLAAYWLERFDWREQEAALNRMPQYTIRIEEMTVHFAHVRASTRRAFPLLLTHGWPGTFADFSRLAPMLATPERYGGDSVDGFDLVIPSIPGSGFSAKPTSPGIGGRRIAHGWLQLMQKLGYEEFGVAGSDWGSGIATWLARIAPERVRGLHLDSLPASYEPNIVADQPLTDEEGRYLRRRSKRLIEDAAEGRGRSARPQANAFALEDSPLGLAAWLVDKYTAWSDCGGDVTKAFTFDQMLTTISLYWHTGTAASSLTALKQADTRPAWLEPGERIRTPLAFVQTPKAIRRPPKEWIARGYDLQCYSEYPSGGHFVALENPEQLANDIRAFFRSIREGSLLPRASMMRAVVA